ERYGLAHLLLNPRTITFFQPDQPLLTDFGLAQLLWLPSGQPVTSLNLRYAAPEVKDGQPGPASDQYSLALIYLEMRTGGLTTLPQGGFNVDQLPEADRAVVARALDPVPERRHASALDLVAALQGGAVEEPVVSAVRTSGARPRLVPPAATPPVEPAPP